jgi:hypothetical protein
VLDKCIELVTQVSGRRPTGYVAPWWEFSTVTNELLLERHSSARGDRRQPHGSFLTRRWRGMDSNHRYPVREATFCGMPPFRSPVSRLPHQDRLLCARNRWFESISLQRRVSCEPDFLDQGGPFGIRPAQPLAGSPAE